jgi:subtilisin-like proprotein convertase family protein
VLVRYSAGLGPGRLTSKIAAMSLVAAGTVVATLATAGPAEAITPAAPGCGSAATTTTFPQNTAVTIPTGPAVVTSTVVVSGAGSYVLDVDAVTGLTHSFPGDIDMTLTSPAGTVVTLTSDNAGTNDDAFNGTRWDDDANPAGQVPYSSNNGMVTDHVYAVSTPVATLTPEEPLGAFVGENPNGTWTLTLSDDSTGDGGQLASWKLDLSSACAVPPPDTQVAGAKASTARKHKLGKKTLTITSVVSAGEAVSVRVSGVAALTSKAKTRTYPLVDVNSKLSTGASVTLEQSLAGGKKRAKKTAQKIAEALKSGGKASVTLTFVYTDAAGNVVTLTRSTKVKL